MANSVDPDGTARCDPSHLDLNYLRRHLYWSAKLKGLTFATLRCALMIFFILPRKLDLIPHANCLHFRLFARNVKTWVLGKIRTFFQCVICSNFHQTYLALRIFVRKCYHPSFSFLEILYLFLATFYCMCLVAIRIPPKPKRFPILHEWKCDGLQKF